MTLRQQLECYTPYNEQEQQDREMLLHFLDLPDVFTRRNTAAHFTASGWVVSPDRKKVLMVYHNLYDSWAWMGGHADGMTDLRAVAEKEIREECGLTHLKCLSEDLFSLEALTVDGHEKRGQYVSSHLHLNVTYLFEADPSDPIFIKPDENSAVAWFPAEQVMKKSSEKWFCDRIYSKLLEKVQKEFTKEGGIG